MRLALINPPLPPGQRAVGGATLDVPLGLAYLGAVARDALAVDVEVLALDMALAGAGQRELHGWLCDKRPDVVGVTSITPTFPAAMAVTATARAACPGAAILAGGPHVSFDWAATLRDFPAVDAVVRLEGETVLPALLRALEGGKGRPAGGIPPLPGVAVRGECGPVLGPAAPPVDPNALPLPARDLFPVPAYRRLNEYTAVLSARGCPFRCVFCVPRAMFGRRYRPRAVEAVVDEVARLAADYRFNRVSFADDLFTCDRARVSDMCRLLRALPRRVTWACSARVDTVTPELLAEMRDAGLTSIFFGIESGAQEVLRTMEKGFIPDQARRAVRWARDAGLEVQGSFIIGLPGETLAQARATVDLARELQLDRTTISPLTPYPGTAIGDDPQRWGITVRERAWDRYNMMVPVCETAALPYRELAALWMEVLMEFYVPAARAVAGG